MTANEPLGSGRPPLISNRRQTPETITQEDLQNLVADLSRTAAQLAASAHLLGVIAGYLAAKQSGTPQNAFTEPFEGSPLTLSTDGHSAENRPLVGASQATHQTTEVPGADPNISSPTGLIRQYGIQIAVGIVATVIAVAMSIYLFAESFR